MPKQIFASLSEGFRDESYLSLEREYKWKTQLRWQSVLGLDRFQRLLDLGEFRVIATRLRASNNCQSTA